jgi:hypothetical protein
MLRSITLQPLQPTFRTDPRFDVINDAGFSGFCGGAEKSMDLIAPCVRYLNRIRRVSTISKHT